MNGLILRTWGKDLRLSRGSALFAAVSAAALLFGCGDPPLSPEPTDLAPAFSTAATTLTATAASPTSISLTWTDNVTDETGYEIWRSKTGPAGSFSKRTTTAANVTTYKDTGLSSGTEYCYKVRSIGGSGGTGAFSSVVCATTPPKQPSSLVAAVSAPTTITLTWVDNSTNESGFELWRSTTGISGTYTLLATVAANATTAPDAGLAAGKQYCYRVRAIGAGSIPPSAFSNKSCATTPAAPAAPTGLTAAQSSPTVISLAWTDKSSNEAGFEIWRSTTGASGTYDLLLTTAANTKSVDDTGLTPGAEYCYKVRAVGAGPTGSAPASAFAGPACATTPLTLVVRIVLFGDSNTDRCEELPSGTRLSSYVSVAPRLGPDDPHMACSVAGKVQASWQGIRSEAIRVVNHAIASSTTGGGGFGGPNRTKQGAPNARTLVNSITRFQGEVLAKGYPWSGGEPTNTAFPTGPVLRVNAYAPGANDFAYVSMGTNDDAGPDRTMTPDQTTANLRYMIQQWTGAGRAADHFILTTLAPRDDANSATSISDRNTLIRALAAELGVHLIDLAAYVSDDNGATWRSTSLNIGDGVHYTEAVRGWLGDQVASWMSAEVPAGP